MPTPVFWSVIFLPRGFLSTVCGVRSFRPNVPGHAALLLAIRAHTHPVGIFHPTHWMDSNFEGPQPRGSPFVSPIPYLPAEDTSVRSSSNRSWSRSSSSGNGDSSSSRLFREVGSIHPIPSCASQFLLPSAPIRPLFQGHPFPSIPLRILCPPLLGRKTSDVVFIGCSRPSLENCIGAAPHTPQSRAQQTTCATHVQTTPANRSDDTGSNRDAPAAAKQGRVGWERAREDQRTEGDT